MTQVGKALVLPLPTSDTVTVHVSMSRTWDLTVNNYTQENIDWLQSIVDEVNKIKVSKEVGDEETPHLQGRITFKRTYRMKALKKLSGDQFHWEPTKCGQDSLYVIKHDSEVIIDKDNRQPGKRNDLVAAVDSIKAGATTRELWEQHTTCMVKYERGLKRARDVLNPTYCTVYAEYTLFSRPMIPCWKPTGDNGRLQCYVFIGPPNTGKTEYVKAHFTKENPALQVNHVDQVRDYFQYGYHTAIIFDDCSFKHMPREAQLAMVSSERDIDIHCRHANVTIPKGVPRIFIGNEYMFMEDSAISSRIRVESIYTSIISPPNEAP